MHWAQLRRPGPPLQPLVSPERDSNPLSPESLSLSLSLAGPGRGAWSSGPYPELWGCAPFSLGRGARWGGGDIGREGRLQKARCCKSVAGGRPGKTSASPMSAPAFSDPRGRARAPRPARVGPGAPGCALRCHGPSCCRSLRVQDMSLRRPSLPHAGARTQWDPEVQSPSSLGDPLSLALGLGTCQVPSAGQVYGRERGLSHEDQRSNRGGGPRPESTPWASVCMLSLSPRHLKGVNNGFL